MGVLIWVNTGGYLPKYLYHAPSDPTQYAHGCHRRP